MSKAGGNTTIMKKYIESLDKEFLETRLIAVAQGLAEVQQQLDGIIEGVSKRTDPLDTKTINSLTDLKTKAAELQPWLQEILNWFRR
jgi:hypothetical protein